MSTDLEIYIFHIYNNICTMVVDVFCHNRRLGKEMQSMFRYDEIFCMFLRICSALHDKTCK